MLANVVANAVADDLGEAAEYAGDVAGDLVLAAPVKGGSVDGVAGPQQLVHSHVERQTEEVAAEFLFVLATGGYSLHHC